MNLQNKFIISCIFFAHILYATTNKQSITLFAHGIIDNHTMINRYMPAIEKPWQTFDFADAQKPQGWNLNHAIYEGCAVFGKLVNRDKMYMGQDLDIQTLAQQIDNTQSYILYGISRGGATAINYLAQYNPDNIQALILESTPADMVDAIDTIQKEIGFTFAQSRAAQEQLFHTIFPAYPLHSIPPITALKNIINKNLPIFIVHALDDQRVSITAAWRLYLAFVQAGFFHVYLCELDHGKHGSYLQSADAKKYLHAIHSFYKKYHFAYQPAYADQDVTQFQPTIQDIKHTLHQYQTELETKYIHRRKTLQTNTILAGILLSMLTGLHYTFSKQNNSD